MSKLEFFHNAYQLRKAITVLLLKDFGIRDKVRNIRAYVAVNKFDASDREEFLRLCDKYNVNDSVLEAYPTWLLNHFRTILIDQMNTLINNITYANSVYPTREMEYDQRRAFQNRAIANCYQILQSMQYVISILPVDAEKYMPYVAMVDREIALLKGWRKSDNKILKGIKERK
ncbi:MAG: hypothetical protein LKF53_02670 [Solobacterium sp.]|nr:hypothetical protein [Solobacterium sp.]MCH4205282.1 hypothetical protein [Solobacterium sp.]MCH4226875.1 hypothetical protein [Solobacterium sp.]MCH4281635.1 hypothetical protein [Solobacterium sp.]